MLKIMLIMFAMPGYVLAYNGNGPSYPEERVLTQPLTGPGLALVLNIFTPCIF